MNLICPVENFLQASPYRQVYDQTKSADLSDTRAKWTRSDFVGDQAASTIYYDNRRNVRPVLMILIVEFHIYSHPLS